MRLFKVATSTQSLGKMPDKLVPIAPTKFHFHVIITVFHFSPILKWQLISEASGSPSLGTGAGTADCQ